MSHFVVLVVGNDVGKQLDPFWELDLKPELLEKDPRAEFHDRTKEVLEGWETDTKKNFYSNNNIRIDDELAFAEIAHVPLGAIVKNFYIEDSMFVSRIGETVSFYTKKDKVWFKIMKYKKLGKRHLVDMQSIAPPEDIPVKKAYADIDEYAEEYHGYHKTNDGKYGHYSNPRAKWDWYTVGGRWTGYLKLKDQIKDASYGDLGVFDKMNVCEGKTTLNEIQPAGFCDSTFKKNIDIDGMETPKRESAEKRWDEFHQNRTDLYILEDGLKVKFGFSFADLIKSLPEPSQENPFRNSYDKLPEEFKKWMEENMGFFSGYDEIKKLTTMSRDAYAACQSIWSPYALLWNDKWYAHGEMGWFGISSDEEDQWPGIFKELWAQIPEDALITVCDLHI